MARKRWVFIGLSVCVGFVALGLATCTVLKVETIDRTEVVSTDFSSFVILDARSTNGSVSVERAEGRELKVDATIRARDERRLAATRVAVRESSPGVCEVFIAWPDGQRLRGEGADLRLHVPHAAELRLETSNGDVQVAGFIAMISITSTNGAIRASGPAHQVDVRTTNGTIDLEGPAGPVRVRSTNGRFDIALAPDNPGPVFLTSTNGGGTLAVGPAFAGELSIRTSNGKISLDGFEADASPRTAKGGGRTRLYDFGPAPHRSRLQTTNGDVVIRSIRP